MIFILVKKIAVPVAFIVAWVAVSTFAIVKASRNNEMQIEFKASLAQALPETTKNVVEETENNETEVSLEDSSERTAATSRSGSHSTREARNVYYEKIDLNIAEDEVEVLERIAQAEAGGSGYDAMLAVVNVVLNRVRSERFPNTITDVVFARRQFTPTSDGRYYSVKVSDTAKQVVADALDGARIIGEDAYYFCTPTANGKGWFETALRKIDYIAPHNFYGYKEDAPKKEEQSVGTNESSEVAVNQ